MDRDKFINIVEKVSEDPQKFILEKFSSGKDLIAIGDVHDSKKIRAFVSSLIGPFKEKGLENLFMELPRNFQSQVDAGNYSDLRYWMVKSGYRSSHSAEEELRLIEDSKNYGIKVFLIDTEAHNRSDRDEFMFQRIKEKNPKNGLILSGSEHIIKITGSLGGYLFDNYDGKFLSIVPASKTLPFDFVEIGNILSCSRLADKILAADLKRIFGTELIDAKVPFDSFIFYGGKLN